MICIKPFENSEKCKISEFMKRPIWKKSFQISSWFQEQTTNWFQIECYSSITIDCGAFRSTFTNDSCSFPLFWPFSLNHLIALTGQCNCTNESCMQEIMWWYQNSKSSVNWAVNFFFTIRVWPDDSECLFAIKKRRDLPPVYDCLEWLINFHITMAVWLFSTDNEPLLRGVECRLDGLFLKFLKRKPHSCDGNIRTGTQRIDVNWSEPWLQPKEGRWNVASI